MHWVARSCTTIGDFVIRCDQVTKLYCTRYGSAVASSARNPRNFGSQAYVAISVFREVSINTVLPFFVSPLLKHHLPNLRVFLSEGCAGTCVSRAFRFSVKGCNRSGMPCVGSSSSISFSCAEPRHPEACISGFVCIGLPQACLEHWCSCEWKNGETPRLTSNGKTITCKMNNVVPLVVPGLSSSSSSSSASTSRPMDQSKSSGQSEASTAPMTTRRAKQSWTSDRTAGVSPSNCTVTNRSRSWAYSCASSFVCTSPFAVTSVVGFLDHRKVSISSELKSFFCSACALKLTNQPQTYVLLCSWRLAPVPLFPQENRTKLCPRPST